MDNKDSSSRDKLVARIREGDRDAFEELFNTYYSRLCVFSNSYVKSLDLSRDVVQEVFIKIWKNREDFTIDQSIKAYLYQAVRNQSLNLIKRSKREQKLEKNLKKHQKIEKTVSESELNTEELTQKIWKLVDQLPERRRAVFVLYRKHGLSYSEIGDVMGITRKTVENQMGKSLQFLRENLDL